MQRALAVILVLSIWVSTTRLAAHADEAGKARGVEQQVTVDFNDGSRIVGTAGGSIAVRHTLAGDISIPATAVDSIRYEPGEETAHVRFRNGDIIWGEPDLATLRVETVLGIADMPAGSVRRVLFSGPLVVSLPILFEHPRDAMDWQQYHSTTGPVVRDGALTFNVTGSYPWLMRSFLALPAESCDVLVIRMRKTAGARGQVYWSTRRSDNMCDTQHLEFETIPDGKFHDIRVPVGRHSAWRGIITVLRIDPDAVGEPAEVAIESIKAERDEEAPPALDDDAPVVSMLDGRRFIPAPGLVENEPRSARYSQETQACLVKFAVPERGRTMKWSLVFFDPIDTKQYQFLEIRYRAENLKRDDGDFVLWLNDKRDYRHGGFEAVVGREITADGNVHAIRLSLARFNSAWPLAQVVVRVAASERGNAVFILERLAFTREESAPERLLLLEDNAFEPMSGLSPERLAPGAEKNPELGAPSAVHT